MPQYTYPLALLTCLFFTLSCNPVDKKTVAEKTVISDARNTDRLSDSILPVQVPVPQAQKTAAPYSPAALVDFALTMRGTPYVYASSDPIVGFDCSGFITYVFNHFGIAVPRSSKDFEHFGQTIPLEESELSDLILFTGTDSTTREIGHIGIIISPNKDSLKFVHSTSGKANSVTVSSLDKYYLKRFVRVLRIPGK
ncbi:MAG: C40 family peptidase [Ferruginibacter sp.]